MDTKKRVKKLLEHTEKTENGHLKITRKIYHFIHDPEYLDAITFPALPNNSFLLAAIKLKALCEKHLSAADKDYINLLLESAHTCAENYYSSKGNSPIDIKMTLGSHLPQHDFIFLYFGSSDLQSATKESKQILIQLLLVYAVENLLLSRGDSTTHITNFLMAFYEAKEITARNESHELYMQHMKEERNEYREIILEQQKKEEETNKNRGLPSPYGDTPTRMRTIAIDIWLKQYEQHSQEGECKLNDFVTRTGKMIEFLKELYKHDIDTFFLSRKNKLREKKKELKISNKGERGPLEGAIRDAYFKNLESDLPPDLLKAIRKGGEYSSKEMTRESENRKKWLEE